MQIGAACVYMYVCARVRMSCVCMCILQWGGGGGEAVTDGKVYMYSKSVNKQ